MKELLAERADEYADRVLGRVQKARKAVDECYRTFVKAVNCMAFLDAPAQPLRPFIGYMNAEITRLKRQVLKIHVSQKEETGEESGVEAPGEGESGGDGSNGSSGGNGGSTGGSGEPTTPNEPSNPGNGSGYSSEEKFTVAWYLPNGNPIIWYELAPGETIPEAPQCPEGYYWHPYPSVMPNHDLDIIPEPIKA